MRRSKISTIAFVALLIVATSVMRGSTSRADDNASNDLDLLYERFVNPDDEAKPGVYWFFLDGNLSKKGMRADLDALKQAGMGRAIAMEADLGGPKGGVDYMTPEWLDCWKDAAKYAQEIGVELTASVGPGWCGAGGPWIDPEHAMQHLRASETRVHGGAIDVVLPVPTPLDPYFGRNSLGPCADDWANFYDDVAVLAFPTPKENNKIPYWEEKALFYRPPYTSKPNIKPYLVPITDSKAEVDHLKNSVVPYDSIVDVTDKMDADGRLQWNAPEGDWTILRLGRRLTGQTTRPAPAAALGLESDKFEKSGIERHFESFDAKLLEIGKFRTLHHDSWEMSSQNWSKHFRELFTEKRGYDPLKWTPTYFGYPVESVEQTERFLWDLRRTSQELIYENNVSRMKELAAEKGLNFSSEVYDLNPAGDLYLFRAADIPMCEFWAKGYGFDASFTVFEATSSAHTTNKPIVASESFTSYLDKWRQHPALCKRQGDWAFCFGVNRIYFHRMCSQPNDDAPGLSLGPHGSHFDRTQTWFPLLDAYCGYLSRAQSVLQRGVTSSDILFLDLEQAPCVCEAPSSMYLSGEFRDKNRYGFDGVCPQTLIDDATVVDGKIVFPGGASYSALIMPRTNEMTVELATKLARLAEDGALIVGSKPKRSPTLADYPNVDSKLSAIVDQLWSGTNAPVDLPYPKLAILNERENLKSSRWLWSDSNWIEAAAGATPVFSKIIELPELTKADREDAYLVCAADNLYEARVNGEIVGTGNNFHTSDVVGIGDHLKPGRNIVEIQVTNEGEAGQPSPAGMIAALRIGDRIFPTDDSWLVKNLGEDGDAVPAFVIGAYNIEPWSIDLVVPFDSDSTYPNGELIRKLLASRGVKPDFESETDSVRWLHKIIGDVDYYFLGSRVDKELVERCSFRVSGKKAQLWDPQTCRRYAVDDLKEEDGVSSFTLHFDPSQSWFVFFSDDSNDDLPPASKLATLGADDKTEVDLTENWDVTFNQNAAANRDFESGREKKVHFDALQDWSKSKDAYLKYYSGLAIYEKTFDMPNDFESTAKTRDFLFKFDDVQVMAKIELNGQVLGTLWMKPWELKIPSELLRPTDNRLRITVANLWCNRLIGDADKPAEERFTRSSNPMWAPGDFQLQPSGMIGSASVLSRDKE